MLTASTRRLSSLWLIGVAVGALLAVGRGASAVVNDACSAPVVISGPPFHDARDTTAATTDSTDPLQSCSAGVPAQNSNSVWYSYTVPGDGMVVANTFGSDYTTVLTAYAGTCTGRKELACDENEIAFLAKAGQRLLLEVTQLGPPAGGTLLLNVRGPVVNNTCRAAPPIAAPFSAVIDTLGAATSSADPVPSCVGPGDNTNSVWYGYTAPATGTLSVTTSSCDYSPAVVAYTGSCGALTEVACEFVAGLLSINVTAGEAMYIEVVGSPGGNVTLNVSGPPVPPSDDCSAAPAISTLPFTVQTDTSAATSAAFDPVQLCSLEGPSQNSNSVWYRYTAPSDATLLANVSGSDYPAVVSGYMGPCAALSAVPCNPDQPQQLSLALGAGQSVLFEIAGSGQPGGGLLNFSLSSTGPQNDLCGSVPSVIVGAPFSDTVLTATATTSPSDPVQSCTQTQNASSVWYSVVAAVDGTLRADTAGSDYDTVLTAYTGTCGVLTEVACNDDADGTQQSQVSLPVTAGQTIFIEATQRGGLGGGTLMLHAALAPTPTPTPTPSPTPTQTPIPTSSPTATFSVTATPSPTPTPTATLTVTPQPTLTATRTPTATLTSTPLPTSTTTQSPTSTVTPTPTLLPTATPSMLPTATQTAAAAPTSSQASSSGSGCAIIPVNRAANGAAVILFLPVGVLLVRRRQPARRDAWRVGVLIVGASLCAHPVRAVMCVGDCDLNGVVTSLEHGTAEAIMAGQLSIDACPALDANDDHTVSPDEFAAASNAALNGCGGPAPVNVAAAPPSATTTLPPVADFNGDGFADLAVVNANGNSVSIFLGSSSGLSAAVSQTLTGTADNPLRSPRGIALGDFDGDGVTDITVANFAGASVSVFLGNQNPTTQKGDGTFTDPINVNLAAGPLAVAAGRFHGPTQPLDLAVVIAQNGPRTRLGSVSMLRGNGDGTFALSGTVTAGREPRHIVVADFGTGPKNSTRDGKLDIGVTLGGEGATALLYGDGSGGLSAPDKYGAGQAPDGIALGDFNSDGCLDVATTHHGNPLTDGSVVNFVAINHAACRVGFGGLLNATSGLNMEFGADSHPTGITAVQLNGDTKVDLALADAAANTVMLLTNQSTPGTFFVNFDPAVVCPTGQSPHGVAAGDFNGDGTDDVAVANRDSDDVSVFSGDGSGAVCPPSVRIPVPVIP